MENMFADFRTTVHSSVGRENTTPLLGIWMFVCLLSRCSNPDSSRG